MLTFVDRFGAIPGLLITSSVCYPLLCLHLIGWRGSEALANWTKANTTLTALMVQVLSHVLGFIHVYVICTVLRFSFMQFISTKTFPLYAAHFLQAVTTPRMTWDLPWKQTLILILMVTTSLLPGALWAAAMAPLPTEREVTQRISIPTFNVTNVTALFDGDPATALPGSGRPQWASDKGLFGFDYAVLRGSLEQSAQDASFLTNGTQIHSKLDKTGFSYEDRSYGTGSTAGFTTIKDVEAPTWYNFTEVGFQPRVSCIYNSSSNYSFTLVYQGPFSVYQSQGIYPNGELSGFITYAAYLPSDLFGWGVTYENSTQRILMQLVSGVKEDANSTEDQYAFGQFNNMQCAIEFLPKVFNLSVNKTSKRITSTPINGSSSPWPDYGDGVVSMVSQTLFGITYGDACVAGCQLGRALVTNINQLQIRTGQSNGATSIKGTEDSIASIVDNLLVNLLLTRLVSGAIQPTEEVTAVIGLPSVKFGGIAFIAIVSVLNLVIALAYTVEAIRTQAWSAIPPLDVMNLCDPIEAAFEGGRLFERMHEGMTSKNPNRMRLSKKTRMRLQYGNSLKSRHAMLVPILEEEKDSLFSNKVTGPSTIHSGKSCPLF